MPDWSNAHVELQTANDVGARLFTLPNDAAEFRLFVRQCIGGESPVLTLHASPSSSVLHEAAHGAVGPLQVAMTFEQHKIKGG
jgi:hypothetical protein